MNDDRGTQDKDAAAAGPYGQREWPPGQAPGPASPGGTPGASAPLGASGANGQHAGPVSGVSGGQAGDHAEAAAPGATGEAGSPGATTPDERPVRRRRPRSRSWWIELPVLLFFALVLALLIKTFVVQAFYIPSSSMENTLEIGDKVLVNKLVYDFRPIHRGDIVVFNGDGSWNTVPVQAKPPLQRLWDAISGLFGTAPGVHDYIKRVIGVPGDHVACCDKQGRITVNGVPLSERSYLYPGNSASSGGGSFSIVVPPGRLWVMGDHRSVSWDSRGHMSDPGRGTVPEDHVVGRAFLIIAPISRWRILPIPGTFEQPKLARASAAAAVAAGDPPTDGAGSPAALTALVAAPGAPLAVGLAGAFPLTWAQRRLRRRLGGLARGGRKGAGWPGRSRWWRRDRGHG